MTLTREQIAALKAAAEEIRDKFSQVQFPCRTDEMTEREWAIVQTYGDIAGSLEFLLGRIALLADRAAAEGRGAVKGEIPRIDWDHEPTSTLEMVPCSVCGERKEYCACTRGAAGETA